MLASKVEERRYFMEVVNLLDKQPALLLIGLKWPPQQLQFLNSCLTVRGPALISSNPSIKLAKRIDNGFTTRNHSSRHVNEDYSEPSIRSNSWRCPCNPQHIKLNRGTVGINHQTDHPAITVHFRITKHGKQHGNDNKRPVKRNTLKSSNGDVPENILKQCFSPQSCCVLVLLSRNSSPFMWEAKSNSCDVGSAERPIGTQNHTKAISFLSR
ncbi:hypothetical protein KIW84_011898 [Lathyrus oleraceus]|uniref:Uncharacterized protein n=1 Tax=Pisum sativum TaxID=3888 RepID=A0A9D5BG39_PEA|nr:hypothetical protein KIW84_011898 [Pisum sativum]